MTAAANGHAEASTSEDPQDMAAAVARLPQRTSVVMDTRMPSLPVRSPEEGSADVTPDIEVTPNKNEGLNAEIQMLSTKLVNAINYNTNLDDTLQTTRSELDQARQELAKVRAEKRSLDDAITQGVLVKKSEVEQTMASLRADMAQVRADREKAEKAKKQTEGELENLTSALFEEANTMVAAARKDTEAVEKRNSQLKSQLQDTEVLLASQQEQLQDLKSTMEKLERSDTQRDSSIPSTPVTGPGSGFDSMIPLSPGGAGGTEMQPSNPLHFATMLAPILRNDISAYYDFAELISSARKAQPHSRNVSGNYSSTNLSQSTSSNPAMVSSPNLPGAFSFGGSGSANSSPSSSGLNNAYPYVNPPLKESKFWKRILVEDLEPTLRLDSAPGLSFLSRRTVNSALLNGTLVVEPFQQQNYKFYAPVFACALCGESRKTEPYMRKYRFRTSEADDAQRYPLCEYCLTRIRTSCDFAGFLRNVRDGHWRCENETEEKGAWEEAVKLRERMFWARLGGGVVPRSQLPVSAASAQRPSLDSVAEKSESAVPASAAPKEDAQQTSAGPIATAKADADETEAEGIGRALVNMSSRAASSAVPELKPQTPDQFATQEPTDSQAEASSQLQREAETAEIVAPQPQAPKTAEPLTPPAEAALERFSTPIESQPSTPPSQRPLSRTPSPIKSRATSPVKMSLDERRRSLASSPVLSRTTSPTKSTAQEEKRLSSPVRGGRTASPFKRSVSPVKSTTVEEGQSRERSTSRPGGAAELKPVGVEERRPSSQASSVLARVRAMEGKT